MSTAFTTKEFNESAGAPKSMSVLPSCSFGTFVPATTNMTSNSRCISSNAAACGDIAFLLISIAEPSDKFQTWISWFSMTISRICLMISNELNLPDVATPKCRTLNRPQWSFSLGFSAGPSTMIEHTEVPWNLSSTFIGMSSGIRFCVDTHSAKYASVSKSVSMTPIVGSFVGCGIAGNGASSSSGAIWGVGIWQMSWTPIEIKYGASAFKRFSWFTSSCTIASSNTHSGRTSIPYRASNSLGEMPIRYSETIDFSENSYLVVATSKPLTMLISFIAFNSLVLNFGYSSSIRPCRIPWMSSLFSSPLNLLSITRCTISSKSMVCRTVFSETKCVKTCATRWTFSEIWRVSNFAPRIEDDAPPTTASADKSICIRPLFGTIRL